MLPIIISLNLTQRIEKKIKTKFSLQKDCTEYALGYPLEDLKHIKFQIKEYNDGGLRMTWKEFVLFSS